MKCITRFRRIIEVEVSEIEYFKAEGNDIYCFLNNEEYEVKEDGTLESITLKYCKIGMIRVNKSNVINIKYVTSIRVGLYGKRILIMKNNQRIVVSRIYRNKFLKKTEGKGKND